jgi:hypothetical protein
MKMITSFDPTTATSGTFDHKVSNPCGGVYLFNESNVWLQLRLPGGHQVGLPAWWARFYRLDEVLEPILWSELATISTIASPLSQVYGEAYESSELKNRSFYDGPIPRNPYIANQVSSAVSTNQVINDGNPAGTTVVEATQSGNTGGSNLYAGNDGTFYVGYWSGSGYNKYFQLVSASTPKVILGKGTFIRSLDAAGANEANILGVDGSGNTFIQNHPTNNETVIYDKNGVPLVTVDSSGNVKAKGNNNNKLSNVTFLATPYLLDNNGSLAQNASSNETVTGGSTGVPTGAIAVILSTFFAGNVTGTYLQWSAQGSTISDASNAPLVICQNGTAITSGTIIVPVNTSNGQITVTAKQGNASGVHTSIIGYII